MSNIEVKVVPLGHHLGPFLEAFEETLKLNKEMIDFKVGHIKRGKVDDIPQKDLDQMKDYVENFSKAYLYRFLQDIEEEVDENEALVAYNGLLNDMQDAEILPGLAEMENLYANKTKKERKKAQWESLDDFLQDYSRDKLVQLLAIQATRFVFMEIWNREEMPEQPKH